MAQTEEDKKKRIEDATRVFKEMLEKTYLGKKNSEYEFYSIGVNNLTQTINGNFTRIKDGSLKLQIKLPSFVVKSDKKGLPNDFNDWDCFPLLILLNHSPIKD